MWIAEGKGKGKRFSSSLGILFVLALSGCSHTITTPPATLAPLTEDAPTVRVERDAVTDFGSTPAYTYASFDADLHKSLQTHGRPQITGKSSAPLVLSEVNITSQKPQTHDGLEVLLGVFSFFLPPLAFIPTPAEIDYAVDYTLDDAAGREVMKGRITDTVKGKSRGWYVARVEANTRLVAAAGAFAAENSARLVINDLRRHNEPLVAAADRYRSNPKLHGSELAAARERGRERERKRSDGMRASFELLAAKRRAVHPAGFGGLMVAPAAIPAAAVVQVRGEKPIAILMRPSIVGPTSEMQDQILHNTMRSVLSETHRVISAEELEEVRVEIAGELGQPDCSEEACQRQVFENLNADHRFTLRILREASGAQLIVGVDDGSETTSRSSYCDACTTGGMDEKVSALTGEVSEQVAPPAPVPAAPAMAAGVPAMVPMAGGAAAMPVGNVVGAVADVAKQCLAKTVAMQACSMVPGFGKLACRAIAQAKFSGLPCP